MKNHIPVFIILFIFLAPDVWAQEVYTETIRGTVVDAHSELPLPGASVVVVSTEPPQGTITDAEGRFRLDDVPVGRHNIQVTFIGYHPLVLNNLDLSSGKEMVLNLSMQEKVYETEEVVVKAYNRKDQPTNDMALISARSFTVEETERFAGSLGDPSRMVANYAGVLSASDERNDIIIRGNSPLGLLWRLDGVDIPNPNHFGALGTTGGPVSMLNNNLLTNSDFYTGAFPAEYGNAVAGAFDLQMRNGNNETYEFVGQIGFNGFELGAEGPISKARKSSFLANYRYSTLAVFNALGFDMGTGASVPQYQDVSFKLNFPTAKGRLSLFGIGGISYIELHDEEKDESEFSYGVSGTNTDFGSDMAITALQYVHFLTDHTRLISNLSVQYSGSSTVLDSLDRTNDYTPYPYYRSDFSETKYTASSQLKTKFDARNTVSLGAVFDVYQTQYVDSVKEANSSRFITLTHTNGEQMGLLRAFGEWQHRFTNELTLYSGLHLQHFTYNGSTAIEPRISWRWQFLPGQALNMGFGMHSQLQPRMSYFLLTELDNGQYISTNDDLDFTKSIHYVLGYDYLLTSDLRLKIEAYYQDLYNVPVNEHTPEFSMLNAGDFFAVPSVDSLVNKGTGENYGVELTFERFFQNNYYFLLTTSLYESTYKGYDGIERNTAFNGNFVINALAGYELPVGQNSKLAVNLRGIWAGNKRYVPLDLGASIAAGEEQYNWSKAYEQRYDDYLKLDVRISFKVNGKKLNQEWALDIQNVTDNQNIFREVYNPAEQRIETEYQSGIYPMFLYRIQF